MTRTFTRLAVTLAVTMSLTATAQAQFQSQAQALGSLQVRSASGEAVHLELTSVHVEATLLGDVVETHVHHVFHNPTGELLEGTFRFPLPADASVVGLAMDIDGELMEGELVEKEKAQGIYQSIVDAMRDPAILEWEGHDTFKLRVFPIPPNGDKHVVLRFLAPLEGQGESRRYVFPTAAPALQATIPTVRLDFDGQTILDAQDFAPGREVSVPVTADLPTVMTEDRGDEGQFFAVRVDAGLPEAPDLTPAAYPRQVLVLVDTSRSALESQALAREAAAAVLGELTPSDRMLVAATDVTTRPFAPDFVPATADAIKETLDQLATIAPDGASDLEAALRFSGQALTGAAAHPGHVQVVYIGDAGATWGETDPEALATIARQQLGDAPLHVLALGKRKDLALARRLAAGQGGRAMATRRQHEVREMARFLDAAAGSPRLRDVQLAGSGGQPVSPDYVRSLFPGDTPTVLLHVPSGELPPEAIVMTATLGPTTVTRRISLTSPTPTPRVAYRWAGHRLDQMTADGAEKEEIVAHSITYGVLSKHTALLVLESEEAYRQHGIERRKAAEQAKREAQRVSGADLSSLGADEASLHPDHIQPGDPEIRVPAPEDARSVIVVFPFGEAKVARYEPELRAWTVRFLIDDSTPDGTYWVQVRITHADGRLETLRLSYVVDTTSPTVEVSIRPARRGAGRYEIRAAQIATEVELDRVDPEWRADGTQDEAARRFAHIVTDVKRVEVRLPDGTVLPLTAIRLGNFRGFWTPEGGALTGPVTLEVVAVDTAHNARTNTMVVTPRGSR